jgi:hypothetical protein
MTFTAFKVYYSFFPRDAIFQNMPQFDPPQSASAATTDVIDEQKDDFDPASFDLHSPNLLTLDRTHAQAVALHHGADPRSLPSNMQRLRAILLAQWVRFIPL